MLRKNNKNQALQVNALVGLCYMCYNIILTQRKPMNTQQIYDYVQAMKHQAETENLVNSAFQQLNSDNCILGTAQPVQTAYTKLVQQLITPEQWGWLEWWMYETDFGQRSMQFSIDNEFLDASGMTFYKFWEVVNA
jgi:hypothetical protein